MLLVQRERLLTDADGPVAEVGTVNFAVLAEPREQLNRLHRIAPLVVSAPEREWVIHLSSTIDIGCTSRSILAPIL